MAATTTAAHTPDLRVQVAGLSLQNPIIAASGTCGYGEELHPFVDLNCLGAVVVKGLSLKPTRGNPGPRLVETSCGMLNSVGLLAFPLRMISVVGSKHADNFPPPSSSTPRRPRLHLPHQLPHPRHRRLQVTPQPLQHSLLLGLSRLFHPFRNLLGKALGLPHHPSCRR